MRESDQFIPLKDWEQILFHDILDLDINPSVDCNNNCTRKKRKKEEYTVKVGERVLVSVLRTFSFLDVDWQKGGHENVSAMNVKHQHRLKYPKIGPFRQFVSMKEIYSPGSKSIGVTMQRNHSEQTVRVQWLTKPGKKLKVAEESEFDLIPHQTFGNFHVGQLVERSHICNRKDFIVGVIQEITKDGYIKAVITDIKGKSILQSLSPDEIIVCPSVSKVGAAKIKLDLWKLELEQDMDMEVSESEDDTIFNKIPPLTNEFLKAIARDKISMEKYRLKSHLGIKFQSVGYRDFCTAIIFGPEGTPYEDGLFMFEFYFPYSYPNQPPLIKMVTPFQNSVSFHLGLDGQVVRKVNDVLLVYPAPILWKANVTLEELLLTIKNFIFVQEPFIHTYHDWDNGMNSFDVERIKLHKKDSLQRYNSNVLVEVYDSLIYISTLEFNSVWSETIFSHLATAIPKIAKRLKCWNSPYSLSKAPESRPKFTLLPVSKGLKQSIRARVKYEKSLKEKA